VRFLLALALLLAAACSGGETQAEPSPRASDPHGELACDEPTLRGIDATIDGQLAAFADGDFVAALGFASERFRSGTTPAQFQATIEAEYPLLIGASGHRSEVCVRQGDVAQLLVTIDARGEETDELLYQMAREDGQWRIDVAGRVPSEEPIPV